MKIKKEHFKITFCREIMIIKNRRKIVFTVSLGHFILLQMHRHEVIIKSVPGIALI